MINQDFEKKTIQAKRDAIKDLRKEFKNLLDNSEPGTDQHYTAMQKNRLLDDYETSVNQDEQMLACDY